jgi:hypothetical protein
MYANSPDDKDKICKDDWKISVKYEGNFLYEDFIILKFDG